MIVSVLLSAMFFYHIRCNLLLIYIIILNTKDINTDPQLRILCLTLQNKLPLPNRMSNVVVLVLQVVYGGSTEWDSVWALCSSPEWIAHKSLSQGFTQLITLRYASRKIRKEKKIQKISPFP